MAKTKIKSYKAYRQFIGTGVENEDGSNTNELYKLEERLKYAFDSVIKWREEHFKEHYWQEALPQTLLTILESYDLNAGKVASRCFLEVPARDYGKGIEIKVK